MVKLSSKTLALVISAIKNMRESKGSTSRDILNYISSVHDIPQDVAKRQMVAALKRGVAHGIIKKSDGYYSLPTDTEAECMEVAAQELGLLDLSCRRKKREARKRKASSKRKRRSSRKGGCKVRRGRSRSKKRKSRSKRGCGCKSKSRRGRSKRSRRSKRGRHGCKPKRKSRRSKRSKCDEMAFEEEKKSRKCRSEQLNADPFDDNLREFEDRPRSKSRTRSKSKSRSRSRNRNVLPTA